MNDIVTQYAPYIACIRLSFLKLIAYRMRYFTGIVTYFMFVSAHYYIWDAVYKGQAGGSTINGYTFSEIITYISVAWMARSVYFSDIDEEIAEMVRSGQISLYLLRPVHFHLVMISEACGGLLFRLIFFTLPISLVIFFFFPVTAPASMLHGVTFLLATIVSFLVLAEINFLLGLLCFYLKSIEGFMRAKYFFIQLFSGLLLPFSFFPQWFTRSMDYLPFRLIAATPLEIYLGKIEGTALIVTLMKMGLWVFLLFLLSEFFYKRAFKKLLIQGG